MLVPLALALYDGDDSVGWFGISAASAALVGGVLVALFRRYSRELSRREGILLVVCTWLCACLFGSLPYHFSPYFHGFTNAFFESVSGFTTTGATILERIEVLPRSLQFWRCFSHWLGGMGIIVLGIAILPLLGHGGMELYRAEFSGARSEKLKPRIAETAISLWKIYFVLTVAEYAALRWAGMNSFEAICNTFSTVATGGFSTRTASIAGFQSPTIEVIVIVFMLLAGISFVQHYRLWVEWQPRRFFTDVETRSYVLLFGSAAAVIAIVLFWRSGYAPVDALRSAAFQTASLLTGTGLVTDDYEAWPYLPQLILLALMFVGGCTGSTTGGMKVARIVLLARVVDREFKRMVERHGVFPVRLGRRVIPEQTVQSLLSLVYLAFVINGVSCLLLAAVGVDVLTSIAAVAASMFNVGPGLAGVGPTDNYAHLPALAKWVLSGCMIAGRLEFYTVLVILTPAFWRK